MKVTIKVEKEVDIKVLEINAKVRYWEDSIINGVDGVDDVDGVITPFAVGEYWKPRIELETGIIINWLIGTEASIHFKICDCGSYYLKDEDNNTVLSIDNDYVPRIACPKENGYGDYIIMDIDKDGQIADWKLNIDDFLDNDED